MMPNCPEYAAIWLGLSRAGCIVALINTNLTGDALLHSVRAAGSTRLIVAGALSAAVAAIAGRLSPDARIWRHGETDEAAPWPRIEPLTEARDGSPISAQELPLPLQRDRALLIYTSGTTGLPKAANVTHGRIMEWSLWFAGMMDVRPEDRMYDCLPMYHSVGGIVAIGALLVKGGSVRIRARFSASRFWDDVVDDGCTIFQYIGELCRYLAQSPPHPKEASHQLRLACGNGMQADAWNAFQQRFSVPRVLEFYAATEGSVSLYNCEGKPGAIGRIPSFLAHRFPIALIRHDVATCMPERDAAGLCIACEPDEPGEAIGLILDASDSPARLFDGYTDPGASAKKELRDVFTRGDRWFRTGDLMRKDAAGYYYFVDRIGDTFRWKGENVSTTEVAGVLRAYSGIVDAAVYGVVVPGHEGRAGMAAITTNDHFEFAGLRDHLTANLPKYARPLFIRQRANLDITGTFKLTKNDLTREGYANTGDPVWFNDNITDTFIPCDAAIAQAIQDGTKPL
jgi:fatty-acyl-CoA synthase